MPLTPEARDLVARTILGETGGQDQASMAAVANVIKNRLNSGAWGPSDRLGPVIKTRGQFASYGSGNYGETVSASDPAYQRAAAIADQVFGDQAADNTGGATHFYANKGPNAIAAPSWAAGQQGQQFGDQIFYKLPLTPLNTAGTGVTGPSSVGQGQGGAAPLDAFGGNKPVANQAVSNALASAKSMLGKNEVPNHDEIMSYLHDGGQDLDPHKAAWCAAFVSASLQKAGLPVPTQVAQGSAYGAGAWAPNYLTYGSAVNPQNIQAGDILVANNGHHVGFAEGAPRMGANGPEVQMIAGNDRDTSGQYAPGAGRAQVGMVGETWVPLSEYSARRYVPTAQPGQGGIGSDATKPLGTAPAGTPPAVTTIVPNPNVAAPAAQPVSAAMSAGQLPRGQPDPNARFQVLQTMGQGGRPGLPYTALNLTPGAGSTSAAAPAPAAPATPPAATPDLTQRVPLNQTLPPPPRPTPSAIGAYPDSTNYPTGLGLTPPTQTSSMPQPFQTSLSNPVQAFLSRLFQTG